MKNARFAHLFSFDYREELMVMENLRKRVPACDLERTPIDQRASRKIAQQLASKPLKVYIVLPSLDRQRFSYSVIVSNHRWLLRKSVDSDRRSSISVARKKLNCMQKNPQKKSMERALARVSKENRATLIQMSRIYFYITTPESA